MTPGGALDYLRVLDWGGWHTAYASRLLADAGADVIRIVDPEADELRAHAPLMGESQLSVHDTWYNAGKRIVALAPGDTGAHERVIELVASADVLFTEWSSPPGFVEDALRDAENRLVRVDITPFGDSGPWRDFKATELVANALSGAASVTGNKDTPPINGYGRQTTHTVGLYAAVCAMAGTRLRRLHGHGTRIGVNAHEALVSCTEQVLMQWFFPSGGSWRTAVAERQGSLHWSRAYEVYPGRNGRGLMVSVALRLFDSLLPWLEEEGAAQELSNREKYPTPAEMIRDLPYLMRVMQEWVAERDADELFYEAQRRHQPFGPVWDIATASNTPQAAARRWFQPVEIAGAGEIAFPGPMVRLGEPPHPSPPSTESADSVHWTSPGVAAEAQAGNEPVATSRPLEGIRVLDFTHVLAGPFGTRGLGDLGAEVIKVGTESRAGGANAPGHPYYASWNRNKRSITLNLSTDEGLEIARRLAGESDIVIENFRAGVLAKWSLDRESLRHAYPGVTVISMGGMGQDGPWKDFVTFAPTIHALTGLTYLTNPPGRHDLGYGFSLTDHLSGLAAAYAACAAIDHRAETGEGLSIDLSQYEVGLNIMGPAFLDLASNGKNPEPVGNRDPDGQSAPHGIYPCAGDDRWVAIAVKTDTQWQALCGVMDRRDLAADARFARAADRVGGQDELDAIIEAWTSGRDRYEVMAALQAAGVPAGAVQDARDLAEGDPQLRYTGFFGSAESETWGTYGIDRSPVQFNGERPGVYAGVREIGVDTLDVLASVLGMDEEAVARAVACGAVS